MVSWDSALMKDHANESASSSRGRGSSGAGGTSSAGTSAERGRSGSWSRRTAGCRRRGKSLWKRGPATGCQAEGPWGTRLTSSVGAGEDRRDRCYNPHRRVPGAHYTINAHRPRQPLPASCDGGDCWQQGRGPYSRHIVPEGPGLVTGVVLGRAAAAGLPAAVVPGLEVRLRQPPSRGGRL